ncbi:T-cell leukemia translocation-altered gene protein isoform X2 [Rhinatrema bivittatum]|nr:T-cell leukemia translocation-altered gene protein isoform X2 [Rhinatrema bivittatum]
MQMSGSVWNVRGGPSAAGRIGFPIWAASDCSPEHGGCRAGHEEGTWQLNVGAWWSVDMDEPWDLEFLSRFLDYLLSLSKEFLQDWGSNDTRVAIFKILLGWLLLSVLAIHLAWRVYGSTVNNLYYRQGMGGQNGGTPDCASHFPI